MLKHINRITLIWHLEKDCNYKCKFCYAHFSKTKTNLNLYDGYKLLEEIKDNNIYKINFAGGEPLLNKNTGNLLNFQKK